MITNAEAIKDAVTIKEVLEVEQIKVDSRGRCTCPVHGGKDKNFSIKDGIGTCWSNCGGKSWDSVGLVMELRGLTYPEALETLAEMGNVRVEYAGGNRSEIIEKAKIEKDRKTVLHDISKGVANYYFTNAYSGVQLEAVDLDGRVYEFETLKKFGVSYTGDKGVLQRYRLDNQLGEADFVAIGLTRKKENTSWDAFQNRIIFPILDEKGRVCGFGGRKLKSDTNERSPKYVNSQQSLIYEKENILYGLYQTKRDIKDAEFAYIVEGYTDVLTCWEHGIKNVVASCGTALTYAQAKLLARYTERVVMLYDGDDAGVNAARKNVETLLKVGLHVEVVILSGNDDPDSFLRKHGADAFHVMVEVMKKNAVLWRVLEGFDEKDIFKKEQCTQLAADLLSHIDKQSLKDEYVSLIVKATKIQKKVLTDLLKEREGYKLDKTKSKLTIEQQRDVRDFGIYIDNNQYFQCSDVGSTGWGISNFIIKPIMLVIGSDKSWRLVEVINQYKRSFIADIQSDSFVEINAFKKEVERRGNYLYYGKPEIFTRVKAKLYAETPECYPIHTLGYHNAGFWTWGNGISVNGEFKAVNEYGIVEHDNTKYFLPAFSKVRNSLSDDSENQYEDEREFIMVPGKSVSFNEWTRRMVEVHGNNGMMGVAYYAATLFRDIIYNKFNYFPHLNLFGPPGAGKSFMAWSIQAMYGKPKTPFHLVQGTNVGFFRRLAKVRNGISWFDEYSNDVPFNRVEALKAAYDGVGHEKGDKDNANNVTRTKVKSACIVSGQQQPTQDVALFKRCISLNFPRFEKSDDRDTKGRALRDIEQTHRLSQITSMLCKFRPEVEELFARTFDEIRAEVSPILKNESTVEDRILNNHLIPLSIYKILAAHLEFSFSYEALRDFVVANIVEQSKSISNQDEMSVWWKMFSYLHEADLLKHNVDFIVQECDAVTIMAKGEKGTQNKKFTEKKTILFLRFEKSHPLYLEYHKRQHSKNGLPESSLKYYLRGSDSFIGEVKAKKFNGQTKYCWAFDMSLTDLNLPLTHLAIAEDGDVTPKPEQPIDPKHRVNPSDLPF
jgi:DNA primase